MKKTLIVILFFTHFSHLFAETSLKFYTNKALKNNLQLNAERQNLKMANQEKNISRSEFLPSIKITGKQKSTTSSNKVSQNGSSLQDSNLDSESKSISLEQKIFSGFKGVNTFKKSELENEKSKLEYKKAEQNTILETAKVYFDLIFKSKNKIFNESNVILFERQVESDSARVQKGEITLTDLAQSESSLAGANAKLIKSKTELFSAKTKFERSTGEKPPEFKVLDEKIFLNLPKTLDAVLQIAKVKNFNILISNLNYEIAIKDLNIERSRLSPSASINFSKTENKDFSSTIDEQDDESVEATITWPIFKGGENISSIKKSSYKKQRAKLILEDTKNKILTETTNIWSNYQSSKSVLEATKIQLKAAEIANEGITSEYNTGNVRTTLEVIQSRSLLLDARISFAKANRDFKISQFELAQQIGTLSLKSLK